MAENYDRRYRGRVTAREALSQSLNASAVRLLARVGLTPFHDLLTRGGLASLDRPAPQYGLPLVLGAGEVSLVELTNLYAALADGGRTRPLIWRSDAPAGAGERLFSAETAWLVTEILHEVRRPDLPAAWRLAREVPAVAWKTGTSYGHRDAWAIGFSRSYTIGVWVGNFDGTPRQGISGAEHAAPLLFDLFRALEPGGGLTRPAGLRIESLEVCALSHQLPGAWCPARSRITYVPGHSRLSRCAYHQRTRIASRGGAPAEFRTTIVYPAELVAWWRHAGQPLPEDAATGQTPAAGERPRIVSPDASTPYHLRRGAPLEHQRIALVAHAPLGVERLWWYRDGLLVASGRPGERLFLEPTPGAHRLVVTDDRGRSDSLRYRVRGAG